VSYHRAMGRRFQLVGAVFGLAACAFPACSEFSPSDASATADGGNEGSAATADAGPDGDGLRCPNAICGVEIAAGQANADEVVVDDVRVYWTIDEDDGAIRARDLGGSGPPGVVAVAAKPRSVYRFADFFHFGSGASVHHVEVTADAGGPSLSATAKANPVTSVARGGGKLFVTAGSNVEWCEISSGNTCTSLDFQSLAPVGAGARALTLDQDKSRAWLATNAAIWKTELGSPNWQEMWPIGDARAIVADETAVYIARGGQGGILKFGRDDPSTAMPTPLAPMAPPAWALADAGAYLVYTAIDQNAVVKVAKDGSGETLIAAGVPRPKGVAVRADKVFVALGDGRIVARPL
jgi:hypothetical protein